MTTTLDLARPSDGTTTPSRRRLRRKSVLIALAAAPAVVIVWAYLAFFTPDSPPKLILSTPAEWGNDAHVDIAAGRWSVGPGSVIGYRVREKLLRLPASNDAVGRTSSVLGDLHLEVNARGVVVQRGLRIEVDLTSLRSDEPRRDDHMRTMAIETDRFPTATFVMTSDLVLPSAMVAGGPITVTAIGDLTVHGVTRAVDLPLQAQRTGDRIEVVGAYRFGWDLFDMQQPNLSYVTVESDPTVEMQLFFDHESSLAGFADGRAAK